MPESASPQSDLKPLSGLKILDFSTLLPGPYASMIMAELGAEILRVESLSRPDLVKGLEPQIDGVSAAYRQLNDKKSVCYLDLKTPEAINEVKTLVKDYDIVLEQFRPGVMDRLGVGYQALREINRQLIYCSITGYGQSGPYRDRAGHDINYLALSGLADYSRRKGQAPVPQGMQIADLSGGSHQAVMAILAAVIQRQLQGKGQYLDISMTDAAFSLNGMAGAAALAGGEQPKAEMGWLNGGTFYDYYETSDGRYMAVGSLEPQFQQGLLKALGLSSLADKCADFSADSQLEVKTAIQDAFLLQSFDYWCQCFAQIDACVEPVLTFQEASEHPQLTARNMVKQGRYTSQISPAFVFCE
ncbi:CaiB/BaiF CoA transferase family protein [Oceanospirillum sp.]|uniref:CaiB/BaiF CoA transferase family protein n=1 Tax=Oceanospirillum sp. TaxID=2021254 RepID=UPI003A8EEF94